MVTLHLCLFQVIWALCRPVPLKQTSKGKSILEVEEFMHFRASGEQDDLYFNT